MVNSPVLRAPREVWLQHALVQLDKIVPTEYERPKMMYVSVGWPRGARKNTIGQCFPPTMSADGGTHGFISPVLDDPIEVLATLLHEWGHAVVGCEHGHRKPFIKFCKDVGLVKPWTATTPSDGLKERLTQVVSNLGPYPHEKLTSMGGGKKQTTRMRLYMCPGCDQKIRAATDFLSVTCDECQVGFLLKQGGNE